MFRQGKATFILVLCLVAGVWADGSTAIHDRGTKKYEGTEAEARQDMDDNVADSSVTSYSNVVIHHTPGTSKNGGQGGAEDAESSRSESYFKVYNTQAKRLRDEHPQRPQDSRILRSEEPKIRHLEGNFRPIENIRQEPKSPLRVSFKQDQIEGDTYRQEPKFTRQREERQQSHPSYRQEGDHSTRTHLHKYEKDHKEEKIRREPKFEPSPNFDDSRRHTQSFRHDGPEHRGTFDFRHETPKTKSHLPPGMTDELMETLLQQEPQTFGEVDKVKRYEPKKKFKNPRGENSNSFNVGYSMSFGQSSPDDVVFGRPKDLKLHVNGQKSVWKQLNEGVEMSQDLDKKRPHLFRVPDSAPRGATPQVNVLKNGASSVFYMNNASPDINTIPTEGKGSFDHNHALTQSNVFDFSNAMSNPPLALPLQSAIVPETQPFSLKPKGRGFDLMSIYQSMGYSPPIPVFIPDSKGEGQMIQAIVIPLHTLTNMDFNWGNFAGLYSSPNTITPQHSVNFNTIAPQQPHVISNQPFNNQHQTQTFHNHHTHFNQPEKHQRSPKNHRKPKDSIKSSSSFSSSPIVVAPAPTSHRNQDLQREQAALNAILAKELSRKNQRHSPLGLRPPPAPHS